MKNKIKWFHPLIGVLLLILFCSSSVLCIPSLEGSWQGTLSMGSNQLRLVFNISKAPDGTFSGTLDSPNQGVKGIPLNEITFANGHVVINVKTILGSYEGDFPGDSTFIKGVWKQSGLSLPLDLKPADIQAASPSDKDNSLAGGTVIAGHWAGALSFQGQKMTIVFNINRSADGKLSSTMDSPDQGVKGILVDSVEFEGNHLVLLSKVINGRFEGDLNDDNSLLTGQWYQGGMSLPLELKRTDKLPDVNRPQEPKPPFPYTEKEVSYTNEKAGITIAGTLTLPQTGGPFPAVLLITGSGPEDRDETVFGHKPFWVLADYLTRQGIAVLRVDDRGIGKSTGDFTKATTVDFADDVLAGVNFLKTVKEVNPKQIGLIGHSEGGIIAPMVAGKSRDVAFIVLMAGPGLTGEKIIDMQSKLILKASGMSDSVINADMLIRQRIFDIVRNEPDSSKAAAKIHQMFDSAKGNPELAQYSPEIIDGTIKQMTSPWLRYFLFYDPKPALTKLKCPVLAINGEKDMQVPPKENLAVIEEALKSSGNKDYLVKELPGLNHLFQTATTGTPNEYAKIGETVSPTALTIISDWILKHVNKEK